MLRDLIAAAVEAQPGLELAGDATAADLTELASDVDVVIAASSAVDEAAALRLLETTPVRVVLLDSNGKATLYVCRPSKEPFGELCGDACTSVDRGARSRLTSKAPLHPGGKEVAVVKPIVISSGRTAWHRV
jgi:pseudouridine-5'-phosphate glycosidase